jgi:CHAT domain-containing protein
LARAVVDQFHELGRGELAGLIQINVTSLIGEVVTASSFRRLLRQGTFDIIHYAGHAVFDEQDAEGSAWLLSDGLLRAREIRNTLAW